MTRIAPNSVIAFVAAIAGVTALLSPAVAADTDEKLENARAIVSGMFDQIKPENVIQSPIPGWYTIQKGSIIAYISDDGRYLMQGDLIDLDLNTNLTEESRNSARRDMVASVDDTQVIKFSPAEIKHTITVFTDTDCTYCRRLHGQIDEYLAYGIEIRYLLYPRNGPASPSWGVAEKVWCASDRNKALTAAKLDRSFQTSACDASTVQDHYLLGQEAGLSGTPAIILEDGTLIGGYMPADRLAAQLGITAASAAVE
jgi:thiol:disulfide interchange protein DsbC